MTTKPLPPWKIEATGGYHASDLTLNFGFAELTYRRPPGNHGGPNMATVRAHLGRCSFIAMAVVSTSPEQFSLLVPGASIDELTGIPVRVELYEDLPPKLTAVNNLIHPTVDLGDLPYFGLTVHIKAEHINQVVYDLGGEWSPEEEALARAAILRHLVPTTGPTGEEIS